MVKSKLPPLPQLLLLLLLHKLVMVKSKLPLPPKMVSSLKSVMVKSKLLPLLPHLPLTLLLKSVTVKSKLLTNQNLMLKKMLNLTHLTQSNKSLVTVMMLYPCN
ncbi:unnamed protein product [[Candida] boidinii]|nr:unnamed protein product [[Candida] boidinii]